MKLTDYPHEKNLPGQIINRQNQNQGEETIENKLFDMLNMEESGEQKNTKIILDDEALIKMFCDLLNKGCSVEELANFLEDNGVLRILEDERFKKLNKIVHEVMHGKALCNVDKFLDALRYNEKKNSNLRKTEQQPKPNKSNSEDSNSSQSVNNNPVIHIKKPNNNERIEGNYFNIDDSKIVDKYLASNDRLELKQALDFDSAYMIEKILKGKSNAEKLLIFMDFLLNYKGIGRELDEIMWIFTSYSGVDENWKRICDGKFFGFNLENFAALNNEDMLNCFASKCNREIDCLEGSQPVLEAIKLTFTSSY